MPRIDYWFDWAVANYGKVPGFSISSLPTDSSDGGEIIITADSLHYLAGIPDFVGFDLRIRKQVSPNI